MKGVTTALLRSHPCIFTSSIHSTHETAFHFHVHELLYPSSECVISCLSVSQGTRVNCVSLCLHKYCLREEYLKSPCNASHPNGMVYNTIFQGQHVRGRNILGRKVRGRNELGRNVIGRNRVRRNARPSKPDSNQCLRMHKTMLSAA